MLSNVNIWAVLVSTIATFLLGWLWYSPAVFGRPAARANGKDMEKCKQQNHNALVFIVSFIYLFISAFAFAYYLDPTATLSDSVFFGLAIGICWVGTSIGVNYLFVGRSFTLFLIDSGYYVVQFVLYGLILGLWR